MGGSIGMEAMVGDDMLSKGGFDRFEKPLIPMNPNLDCVSLRRLSFTRHVRFAKRASLNVFA